MNANAAVALIREKGLLGLSDTEGCACLSFEVFGIQVQVSCRKSSNGVWVSSGSMDSSHADLKLVADEVVSQLGITYPWWTPSKVRLTEFLNDHKQVCEYCQKARKDPDAYYCDEHTYLAGRAVCDVAELWKR